MPLSSAELTLPLAGHAPAVPGRHAGVRRETGLPLHRRWWIGWILPAAILAAWEGTVQLGWVQAAILPSLGTVASTLWQLGVGGDLWVHLGATLARLAGGFAIAAVLGIVIGAACAVLRPVDVIVGTPLAAIRQVPLFGWIPLIAVAAGIGETSKIVFIVLAAFYPVVLNTTEGLRQAPRELVEVGRVLGYGRWTMLVRVRARHAVPAILTGLKHGLTFAGLATVSAEVFMSAGPGLGNLLEYGQATMRIDLVLVGVLLVGVTTMALNLLVERAERRLLRWRPAPRGGAS